ncbi:hypothetical protein [Nocardia sp. NPDC050435]|uniref:hypothetical protein n=1 Tax=Nocardia sp. NPDC050435 TaxID=3155040 RepID=UPI00340FBC1B
MTVSAVLRRVILSRAARRDAIIASTSARIEARWRRTDPWDGEAVGEFAAAAAELSVAAQGAMVSLATAAQLVYFRELGLELEDFFPEVPPEVRFFSEEAASQFAKPTVVLSGGIESQRLSTTEPFNRPARQYRAAVSTGTDPAKALEATIQRAKIIAGTNLALAEREAEHLILKEATRQGVAVIGWRRVIHPEESKSGSCGLCIAASDRLYTVEELKPIHDHCCCETLPVTADNDPGDELNREDLKRLYGDAGGTGREQLKRTRYKVDNHGELQAVLVPARRETVPRELATQRQKPVDLDAFARELNALP